MYNDTIKVANKIITDKDIEEIINRINEEMQECENQYKLEMVQNERYEREYQSWTVRDYNGRIKFDVNFYDDTNITFDNYINFMSIFNSRLHEIKNFSIRYSSGYYRKLQGEPENYISQYIYINIYENKMNIEVNLNSTDKIMNQIYELIKEKILSAPEKYDRVIEKKSFITNKIVFASGIIPSLIILTLLAFIPVIRELYSQTYILYPLGCVLLAFLIGSMLNGVKLERLYKNLVPDKKYAGYDSVNSKSIYKDDIDSFVKSSEIIIGKNIDNIKNRKEIVEIENKYSKYILIELLALIIMSIVIVIIGKFI